MSEKDIINCPLRDDVIETVDCVEIQLYAEGLFKPETLPDIFKQKKNWCEICLNCRHHEKE